MRQGRFPSPSAERLNQSQREKKMTILSRQIAVGRARKENRAPSHDGEYITAYFSDVTGDIVAENNGGTFCVDDLGEEDEDAEVQAEIYKAARTMDGVPLKSCGTEAKREIIALGWATADDFDSCTFTGKHRTSSAER
jgi:hypothetical protein